MRATSQPVAVVPIFAPNTRPNPCANVSRPALTKPIVVIVIALEDWTSSVTMAPQNAPDSGVAAALPNTVRRPEPAIALRPVVITVMPSKNRPTPPRIEITVDMCSLSSRGMDAPSLFKVAVAWVAYAVSQMKSTRCFPLFFLRESGARGHQLFFLLRIHFRVCEIERLHDLHDCSGDNKPGEPLVVGRYDVPRRMLR
jgi:hypothetical protein